jgi:hypothetical protein
VSALLAATSLALVAGCGSSSSGGSGGTTTGGGTNDSSAAPKTELADAVKSLSAGSALTTTLFVGTTSANLINITGEGGDTPLTQTQADLITGARVVIETTAPAGKTLAQAAAAAPNANTAVSITGSTGGTTYFTFKVVNQELYAQLDLKDLLTVVGQGSAYAGIAGQTAGLPQFAQDFLAGKFVAIKFATIKSLTSFLQGALQGSGQTAIPNQGQIQSLIAALKTAVAADLTVARTTTGTTDELTVTGNVHDIASDILAAVATAIPAAASQLGPDAASTVPDKDLTLDASVTGGALSKVSFDFGQFSPHHKDTLPIVATFAKSGPAITAPTGSTEITLQDLTSFFTTIGSASSSS